ncbi:MAG: hypothetical protein HC868_16015 [Sphingomonadales bacterium]|nr:hypothetical protein [Sphingomonadales bacterium]
MFLANPARTLDLLLRAERLSPRDPRTWYRAAVAALAHFLAGDFEEAAACANRALAQSPRFAPTLRVLAASFARLGRTHEVRQAMQDLLRLKPQLAVTTLRGRLGHMDDKALDPFLEALRVAGLPE